MKTHATRLSGLWMVPAMIGFLLGLGAYLVPQVVVA